MRLAWSTGLAVGMFVLSAGAIWLGVRTAYAESVDCSGVIKWNGSISNPQYQWRLDPEDHILFCPDVQCNDSKKVCHAEVGFPEPPSTNFTHNCGCDDGGAVTCSTNVSSPSPWGPIASVGCISSGCELPKHCELRATGGPDPNGNYNASCKCQ